MSPSHSLETQTATNNKFQFTLRFLVDFLVDFFASTTASTARNLRNGIKTKNLDNRLIIKVLTKSG